jgi:branched-chain amino acid transport system permease protein
VEITAVSRTRDRITSGWRAIPGIFKYGPLTLVVAYAPIAMENLYVRDIFTFIGLYVILGMGMNIVVGYAGLLDLGYIAFYGISAYTIAIITAKAAVAPFWAAFPVAVLLAALFGVLLGAPTLRLRPDYLAMVTLGFGEITRLAFVNLDALTGGPPGITGIPRPDLGIFKIRNATQLYWVIVVTAIVITWVTQKLADSRIGRGWSYTREDEIAAESAGIDTVRMKLLAFALGAAFAGVSGALFASKMTMVAPESFTWWESLVVLLIVVLGGMGSIPGVVLGAVVLVSLPEMLRDFADYRMLILGIVLILLALFRPKGLWPATPRRSPAALATGHAQAHLAPRPLPKRQAPVGRAHDPARALLQLHGVSKRFGGLEALADVNLEIRTGEIVSLIGPNGAGKTTLLNIVTGVYPPTAGSVIFNGHPLVGLRPNRVTALGVSRTFQNIRLFSELTVLENVAAGLHCRTRSGALAAVLQTPLQCAEEAEIWTCSLEILAAVGLRDRADDVSKNLSYGNQRRLEICRALASSPRLLILDEPAAGLAAHERSDVMDLIRSLRDRSVTVLLIEHDMDFVMNISDRVLVLNYGKLIAQGTPREVQDNPAVIEAYLGREDED